MPSPWSGRGSGEKEGELRKGRPWRCERNKRKPLSASVHPLSHGAPTACQAPLRRRELSLPRGEHGSGGESEQQMRGKCCDRRSRDWSGKGWSRAHGTWQTPKRRRHQPDLAGRGGREEARGAKPQAEEQRVEAQGTHAVQCAGHQAGRAWNRECEQGRAGPTLPRCSPRPSPLDRPRRRGASSFGAEPCHPHAGPALPQREHACSQT